MSFWCFYSHPYFQYLFQCFTMLLVFLFLILLFQKWISMNAFEWLLMLEHPTSRTTIQHGNLKMFPCHLCYPLSIYLSFTPSAQNYWQSNMSVIDTHHDARLIRIAHINLYIIMIIYMFTFHSWTITTS